MKVRQAREVARQWMVEEASGLPGFCGAYSAGSTNWLADDTELPGGSDLDIMVVLEGQQQSGTRGKLLYHEVVLEASYLSSDRLQSAERVLGDYHLAPSLRTTKVLVDRAGHLTEVLAAVTRDYAKRRWVRERCANARNKVLQYCESLNQDGELHDRVMASLFAAGITTHILLAAGLRNPTVRSRYVAVRELLTQYGHMEFHERLLELLGSARLDRERAGRHLSALMEIFDAAKKAMRTPFPFATDISDISRAMAIDASWELIKRGCQREAMFWIGVTHSRCQKVLSKDAPEAVTASFRDHYQALLNDLGVPNSAAVRRRCDEIERFLPRVCGLADDIIRDNPEIEND